VLARQGDLVVLSGLGDSELIDRLLDLQAEIGGGDGRRFADVIEEAVQNHESWGAISANQPGPALVAFGPAGAGLEVIVSGTAWAEITTMVGTRRLVAGEPSVLLRCLLGSPVIAVHAGLREDHRGGARTDRFSRLDAGIVRAGGLSYYSGHLAALDDASPAGEGPAEAVAPGWDTPGVADYSRLGESVHTIEPPGGVSSKPPEGGSRLSPALPGDRESEAVSDLAAKAAASESGEAASPEPGSGAPGQPFDAVVLVAGTPGEPEAPQPRPPLPRAPQDELSRAPGGPQVVGVYCKNGHFDDPEARFCAVCGISMNQQTLVPRPGPRPPLGVLIVDDGAVFQLDANYVIGREPTLDTSVAAGEARPLRIADESSMVSRVHARIHLDGWLVLVTDLGSANGTRIRLPGQATDQPLTPHVPAPLRSGSRVDLGGHGFRYESHRGR